MSQSLKSGNISWQSKTSWEWPVLVCSFVGFTAFFSVLKGGIILHNKPQIRLSIPVDLIYKAITCYIFELKSTFCTDVTSSFDVVVFPIYWISLSTKADILKNFQLSYRNNPWEKTHLFILMVQGGIQTKCSIKGSYDNVQRVMDNPLKW